MVDEHRPHSLHVPVPLQDDRTRDASGVRMVLVAGRLHDHPVVQGQYGIDLLESWRLTGNRVYLQRAERHAQRLVDRRVTDASGWFYPYQWRHAVHRWYDVLDPPWFSMLAQGLALTLFCRLARQTGAGAWREAADATFRTFLRRPATGRPWGVHVVDDLLWLEEYPHPHRITGDRTYNGHNFSAYGLWDYWMLTRDERAAALVRGALTTTRDAAAAVRRRNWRSTYCLSHGQDASVYHGVHIRQHVQLHALTGDGEFARIAELFYTDYPVLADEGAVHLSSGTHTGYRFSESGAVVDTRTITLSSAARAWSSAREKVVRQTGLWCRLDDGELAGYEVREVPGRVYRLGTCAEYRYRSPRPVRLSPGVSRGWAVSDAGTVDAIALGRMAPEPVTIDRRAAVNGVDCVRLSSGPRAGTWVAFRDVTRL